MRHKLSAVLAGALTLWTSEVARAHEGGIDARGVVKSISDDSLAITTKHGDESFTLTPGTRFVAGKHHVPRSQVKVGDRVAVHARRDGESRTAVEVRGAPREGEGGRK